MRYFMPDTSDLTGGNPSRPSSSKVPTDMDNDPNADEEVIDQQAGEQYPRPATTSKITPDDLADSIAYALDGSGPGPTNDTPDGSGHKVTHEGITGASPDDEEENLRD